MSSAVCFFPLLVKYPFMIPFTASESVLYQRLVIRGVIIHIHANYIPLLTDAPPTHFPFSLIFTFFLYMCTPICLSLCFCLACRVLF